MDKRASVAILVSDVTDFKRKTVALHNNKGMAQTRGYITIINTHTLNRHKGTRCHTLLVGLMGYY